MKKFIQVSLVVVLLLSVAFGLFQTAGGAVSVVAGELQPNVGWNTKPTADAFSVAFVLPRCTPDVGWNS